MKTGRPQTPFTKTCQFLIDPKVYRRVSALAREEGLPIAAVLRRIINAHLTRTETSGTLSS